jgi:hypothetical protein
MNGQNRDLPENLSWYEQRSIRKSLHPLLRYYSMNEFRPSPRVPTYESESFVRGGYQRKTLNEDNLKELSEWLYTLEEGSVVNEFGLKFKYVQDAVYYKLRWGGGESNNEED